MNDELLREMCHHSASINVIRFTEDGTYCMTGSSDRTVKLYNPHKSDPVAAVSNVTSRKHTIEGALLIKSYEGAHGYGISDIAIAKDKTKFASAGDDRTCFVWDVTSGNVKRRITAHNHKINAVTFNKDATVLVSASYDQSVKCWDMRTNNRDPIQHMQDFKDSVTSLALTDSAILAGSIDGTVRIYDLRRGLAYCDQLHHPVTSIDVSDDQQSYLCACLDGTVRLQDISTGKSLQTYTGHLHTEYATEARYQSDMQHVICGSEDGSVWHWELLTGKAVCTTKPAHYKPISSIAYHPSNPVFVTASHDGTARVWKNHPQQQQ